MLYLTAKSHITCKMSIFSAILSCEVLPRSPPCAPPSTRSRTRCLCPCCCPRTPSHTSHHASKCTPRLAFCTCMCKNSPRRRVHNTIRLHGARAAARVWFVCPFKNERAIVLCSYTLAFPDWYPADIPKLGAGQRLFLDATCASN